MADSPIAPHSSSAGELKQRLDAERTGIPFLVFRDGESSQQIRPLEAAERERLTIGRADSADISLGWDREVSRLHAELESVGDDWVISDDGLSRNGTFVNGERLVGRRRLADQDTVRIGETLIVFRAASAGSGGSTVAAASLPATASLSEAQRRVLTALCRPFKDSDGFPTPATNQQIADELFLSVDAVKTHLRALFQKFGVEDLPQNKKRVQLVALALQSGVISPRDL